MCPSPILSDSEYITPSPLSNSNSADSFDDEIDWTIVHSNTDEYNIHFIIFEKLILKLTPVIFSVEGVNSLQSQLASFHLLLYYFDAELATYLSNEGMSTDIYAPSWFITLFARRAPAYIALHLWSLLLQINKPHILILIGVSFMLMNRYFYFNCFYLNLYEFVVCVVYMHFVYLHAFVHA